MLKTTAAIIVAAGTGSRFGDPLPKIYHNLNGKAVLAHSLETFLDHPSISCVQVVIHPDFTDEYMKVANSYDNPKLLPPMYGGATRQDSVRLGLSALHDINPSYVLIHDGARPFISDSLIQNVIDGLKSFPGCTPALVVTDTLKRTKGTKQPVIEASVDRRDLRAIQTPQGFDYKEICTAHDKLKDNSTFTDDTSLLEALDIPVHVIAGEVTNIKITTPEDLERALNMPTHSASAALTAHVTRTGIGYDVHEFEAGDVLTLGGIKIPFDKKLKGHSDADVVLHAICDAILGAISAGDIGDHFPPSNEIYKDVDSAILLEKVIDMAAEKNATVTHIDVTVICQKPRLSEFKTAMAKRIASICEMDDGSVNVKATTTEGLGFTGREEGIAAQAIATVSVES